MFSICFVTTPTMDIAKRIAGELVKKRLIACANIVPQVTSVYEWEGKICSDDEQLMIMKTQTAHLKEIIDNVKDMHPYDCPEVISTPMGQGSPEYLEWLRKNTTLSAVASAAVSSDAAAGGAGEDGESKKE